MREVMRGTPGYLKNLEMLCTPALLIMREVMREVMRRARVTRGARGQRPTCTKLWLHSSLC